MFLPSCTYKCGDITTSCRRPAAPVAPVAPPQGLVPAPAPDPAPTLAPGEVRQLVSALDSVILKINDVLGGGGVTSGLPPRSCSLFVLRVRQFMVAAERGQSNWAALAAEVVSPHAESCNGNTGNI